MNTHNKHIFVVLLVLTIALPVIASGIIRGFSGVALTDKVVLIWQTTSEQNLSKFMVERSTDGEMYFVINMVAAKHKPSNYEYIDKSIFAKPTSGDRVYNYRLKLVFTDNSTQYTDPIHVTPRISGTKHTWGSIKALFR